MSLTTEEVKKQLSEAKDQTFSSESRAIDRLTLALVAIAEQLEALLGVKK